VVCGLWSRETIRISLLHLQMHADGADVVILGLLIYVLFVSCNLPYVEGHLVHRNIVLETRRQFILGTIGEQKTKGKVQ